MDRDELQRLWDAAGSAPAGQAQGPGFMGFEQVSDPAALAGATLAVLGLPAGGWAEAPAAVRTASARYSGWVAGPAAALRAVDYGDVAVDSGDLAATFVRAHERLADVIAAGATPLVLGGDAVVSLPVLQVLSGKLQGRLGVVAFTPAYEVALEPPHAAASRWARALQLGVVTPANLVLVGGRDAPPDAPARQVLDELGVSTYAIADVEQTGIATVAQEALEAAASGTEALYLSVDLGVLEGGLDPVGLTARELAVGVSIVAGALLAAADVCGSGPATGGGDGPAAVAARLAAEIVAGVGRQLG